MIILLEQALTPVEIMNFLKQAGHDFTKQSIISSERRVFKAIRFKVKFMIYLYKSMLGYMKRDDVIKSSVGTILMFQK
jgi:hypothetical protein